MNVLPSSLPAPVPPAPHRRTGRTGGAHPALRLARLCLMLVVLALPLIAAPAAPVAAQEGEWFETGPLNPGLGPAPGWLDRSTPQGTMESFQQAIYMGDYRAAAHLLDLSDIPDPQQGVAGPELAGDLNTVLARKVIIDWNALSDRPDGIPAHTTADQAATPQRSILVWSIDLADRPVPIRLNRVAPEGGEPVWVFARQTVRNLPALARMHGPTAFEEYMPEALRQRAAWGLFWWEIMALPVVAGLAIVIGIIVHRLLSLLARRARGSLATAVLRSVRMPVILVAVSGLAWACSTWLFVFSGPIDVILSPLIATGFVVAMITLLMNTVDEILDRILNFDEIDLSAVGPELEERRSLATKVAAARRAALVIVFLIGSGVVLSAAGLFRTIGFSILASAGVLTLILGFAARDILANIMASLQISANQSARIGDMVMFRDRLCTVERVNFTFVQLRIWTGERLVVPVTTFTEEVFENWMMGSADAIRTIEMTVTPETDVPRLREIFLAILEDGRENEWLLGEAELAGVHVTGVGLYGKQLMFKVPTTDPNTAWDIVCDVRERLIDEIVQLEAAGDAAIFPALPPVDPA
ncbi:mechanosensitive ion channel family protein [Marinibacterium sp. SX1]|uniref:mechanosensitive ion channel family protein n=1 Tax=Marinibacterium sp. SX1 TaxID=3388424 RepID=UPI003D1690F4